jgi:hypothetical protein
MPLPRDALLHVDGIGKLLHAAWWQARQGVGYSGIRGRYAGLPGRGCLL